MSFFETSSDVGRLNTSKPLDHVAVSPETFKLLQLAQDLYNNSGGTFDVMYQNRKEFPEASILFHDNGTVSRTARATTDLGGIAKGYAVDEVAKLVQTKPGVSAVINAGGDIRFVGEQSFPLSIRSPLFDGKLFYVGSFTECAVATSVFTHMTSQVSVSVFAPSCALADSLTKVAFRMSAAERSNLFLKYQARCMKFSASRDKGTQELVQ